jgi:precorrin-2 dehydrogenase/sirohydrochlorin ferrochelatase
MYPILLDLSQLTVLVVGNGREAARRIALLDEANPQDLRIFADAPTPELSTAAGTRMIRRLPTRDDIPARSVLFVGDYSDAQSGEIVALGRSCGALVNVEDKGQFCDFHSTSTIRRGDLLVTISTGGRSPGMAAHLRRYLEKMIGPEWSERLTRMAAERKRWRDAGTPHDDLKRLTAELIEREGWLPNAATKPDHTDSSPP